MGNASTKLIGKSIFFPFTKLHLKFIYCILFLDVVFLVLSGGRPQYFIPRYNFFVSLIWIYSAEE